MRLTGLYQCGFPVSPRYCNAFGLAQTLTLPSFGGFQSDDDMFFAVWTLYLMVIVRRRLHTVITNKKRPSVHLALAYNSKPAITEGLP